MNNQAYTEAVVKKFLQPGRLYSVSDLLHGGPGQPLDLDGPLPDLPPPKNEFVFDRERLTLEIRLPDWQFDFDLTSLSDSELPVKFTTPKGEPVNVPRAFFEQHYHEWVDAVEAAAFEVFAKRRFHRALMFGGVPFDFEVFDVIDSGAHLDWHLGAVQWPDEKPLLKAAVPLFEIEPVGDDTSQLIYTRYLCPGAGILLSGPTGIGKSSLALQFAIAWALGKESLGFEPVAPIATLVIQAENDAGDLSEMRTGIANGLHLSEYDGAIANEMVAVRTIDDATGPAFFARLEFLIREWQPDLIILDPLLAYVGGDISRQDIAAGFLRHRLNPILHRASAAALVVHHTGKPPHEHERERDADYSALGSSELSNWARAIISLKIEGNAYSLNLGKRGKRAGIEDEFGQPRVWLRHATSAIFWQEVEAATVPTARKQKTALDLLALVPATPAVILKDTLVNESAKGAGIGGRLARTFLSQLLDEGKVFEHRQKRAGTRPLLKIGRQQPQEQADLPPAKESEHDPL